MDVAWDLMTVTPVLDCSFLNNSRCVLRTEFNLIDANLHIDVVRHFPLWQIHPSRELRATLNVTG